MQVIEATTGKIGHCFIGPKQYLHQDIRLGEIAICIDRDSRNPARPCIWLIGGIDQCIDYLSLARDQGSIDSTSATMLLHKVDEAKKHMPTSAIERLASILGIEPAELRELAKVAQIAISAPIEGVLEFSDAKPKWVSKMINHASIH